YAKALRKGEDVTKPLCLETFSHFAETSGLGAAIKEMSLDLEDVTRTDNHSHQIFRLAMVQ
ncbi:hypothetical protein BGZ65_012352, partial [Modicella reniformis]